MGLPFREELLYLLKRGWRDRRQMKDRWGVVAVALAALLVLYLAVAVWLWRGSAQSLSLFADRYRQLLFVGGLLAGVLLVITAWWIASAPRGRGAGGVVAQDFPIFSQRAMDFARPLRWVLLLSLVVCGPLAWLNWVALPRCPPHPGVICIRVARFWDPQKQSCDSEESLKAQHALVRAIEVEARKRESLAGRVMVRPVEASVWADDTATGNDRASKLARRLNADLVVWGSLTQGRGADVYWVSVARGMTDPPLSIAETAQKVLISSDPCPPELGQTPLLLATYVIGYGAYVAADYPSAISLFETLLTQLGDLRAPRSDRARVSVHLGTSHMLLGVQGGPGHLEPAMRCLERAVDLASGEEMSSVRADALNNWGITLSLWAKQKQGAEAERLLGEACDKYRAAAKAKPDKGSSLNNWGNALRDWATLKEGAEAERLLVEACAKYEAAVKIKPDSREALSNWGTTLSDRAMLKEGATADRLLAEACEKYAAALAIKPDDHQALYNLALALQDWAGLKEGAEADGLLGDACEKYQAAVRIKPDYHEALCNWGSALSDRARRTEGAEAERFFGQACQKYEAAVKVNPDEHVALEGWGTTLWGWASLTEGAEAERLFREACAKYQAALTIKPDCCTTLNNWGATLWDWARRTEGPEADRLLAEACERFEAALAIKPDYHEALHNWGIVLGDRAMLKQGAEAERLFAQACERFDAALTIKPDYHEALGNCSVALLLWGRRRQGNDAHPLFRMAKEKAVAADRISPGAGAYNAACACAQLGEDEECRRWLETALEHGALPSRAHMQQDPDLESVREAAWFKQILEQAPE